MGLRAATLLCLAALLGGCGCGSDAVRPAFEAQVHAARLPGTHIAWYERGSGRPLLMLTGTGSTMAEWDPKLLRRLATGRRLILFDYPGVGLSGPWRGRSFDSLADSTARLMDALHLPEADVLGWSMGGFVAQRLAVRHTRRVSSLVLAGTNPGGRRAVLGPPSIQETDSDPRPSEEAVLRELYPPGRRGEGRRFLRRLARAADRGEIPTDFEVRASTTDRQVAAEGPWLRSDRNYRQLGELPVPVLAAAGARDLVTPPVNMRRIAGRAPHARFARFPGAHAFLFQSRRRFARAVDRFLRRAGREDGARPRPDR